MTFEGELTPGINHVHRVTAAAGECLRLTIEQRGLDVALTVIAPDGQKTDVHDRDTVDRAESWSFIVTTAGEHRVEVRAAPGTEGRGPYGIRLEERRPANEDDRRHADAERAYLTAQELLRSGQAASLRPALERYEEALTLFQALGDRVMQIRALYGASDAADSAGSPPQALDYSLRQLALCRELADRRCEARALLRVGWASASMGAMQKALTVFEEALPITVEIGDRRGEAAARGQIGSVYSDTGELDKAVQYMEEAAAIWEALKHPHLSLVLNNLGVASERLGDHQKALLYYQRALPLDRARGDKIGEALLLNNIGEIERLLGDPRTAIGYYTQSHHLFQQGGYPQYDAIIISNIGRAHHDLGEYDQALRFLDQALALGRSLSNRSSEAITLQKIGEVLEKRGELEQALARLRQAAQIFAEIDDRQREADTLREVGDVLQLQGRPEEALQQYQRALLGSRAVADPKAEAATLHGMARTLGAMGRLAEAQAHSETAVARLESLRAEVGSPARRASYLASKRDYHELHIDLLMRRHAREPEAGHLAAAFEASERARGRSLIEILGEARANIREGVEPALIERERTLQRQLNAKAERLTRLLGGKHTAAQAEAARHEVESLLSEYKDAEASIRTASPRYAALARPQPLTLLQIQEQVLDADTLLLEYALGRERSYLWAVTPSSVSGFELPPRARIEAAAQRVHELMAGGYRTELTVQAGVQGAALSRMILGPVAAHLGRKRLLIVAEGMLQYVPFGALPQPADAAAPDEHARPGAPLVADHEIVTAPSASALAVLRSELAGRARAPAAVAILADPVLEASDPRVKQRQPHRTATPSLRASPTGGDTTADLVRSASESGVARFQRLRFTRAEADAIVSLAGQHDSLKAVDFAASRATATSPDLSRYRYVHFATHGLLNAQHPELSGIVLSLVGEQGELQDGFLRLHDIYNLRLGAELVVLSACRTALGPDVSGEGLVGLTRGFWYAGAPRVVASLWDVRDQVTAELMRRFYEAMLKDKLAPAAALRAAQLHIRSRKQWEAPYYWAGFVLQGEWR